MWRRCSAASGPFPAPCVIKGSDWSVFSDAFTFAILIVVLCVKPTGLFGEKVTDKV